MTENISNSSNDPKKLNDEDLKKVSGGLEGFFWRYFNELPYKDEIYDYVMRYANTDREDVCYKRLIDQMNKHNDWEKADELEAKYNAVFNGW